MYLRDGPYFFKFDNIHDADNENFTESDMMDAVARKAKEPRHWPGGWGGYSEDDMIRAGTTQVKEDPGVGKASASDTKKDAARATSPAEGKAPIAGSSKVEMEVEAPIAGSSNEKAVEEAKEVEDEEVDVPNPPVKRKKKENSSKKNESSGNIGSLDVRCRDSNMAIGCASFQSDNRCSNPCASGHDCTGPAQPSEDFAFGLLRVRAQHILGRQRRLESLV
jgi:hypothetical protein